MCSLYLEVIRESLSVSLFYLGELLLIFHVNEVNTYPESSWNEAVLYENCQVFGFWVLLWCMLYNLLGSHGCILQKEDSLHRCCHAQKCWYHIQKTAPSPPMAMANASSLILPIPIAVPRDIYKVGRYFRLFAFFLGPLIICRTKGICQIRERRRPCIMDQILTERLCPQNLEEFLGYRYSSEHGSWSCFWWGRSQPGRAPYLFWVQICWYSK